MKNMKKIVMIGFVAMTMAFSTLQGAEGDTSLVKLVRTAMQERVLVQKIAKGYLYTGNNVAATKAEKEMHAAVVAFDKKYQTLDASINDDKIKNLLLFIQSNEEEMVDILKEPYSLENAQELIDLAETIAEGERSVAVNLAKRLKGKKPMLQGQRYYLAQVAKYYIAYTSGIKDKNTVKNMKKVVKRLGELIEKMKSNSGNTPKMNQIMGKIEKQWKIVHKFYLDIEDADLPLIVYDTTRKMDKYMKKYFDEMAKNNTSQKSVEK